MADDMPRRSGRGARLNTPNPFEPLNVDLDPAALDDEERASVDTQFFRDPTQSILSKNESPDIPFTYSLNPYKGCEHGCVYCLSGNTSILMADGTTKPIEAICVGDAIYGTERRGWYRRYVKTRVLDHWRTLKPAYRITLENGTQLVASSDHRFLTERGWKFVTGTEHGPKQRPHLTTNNKLMGTGAYASPPDKNGVYRRGYLCGLIRGDGHLASYNYDREGRSHDIQHQFRLALKDREALDRTRTYLQDFSVQTHAFLFQEASESNAPIHAIRTHARQNVECIKATVTWPSRAPIAWCKGFLAGIFDAEGSYSNGILRISNSNSAIMDRITDCLRRFGFPHVVEEHRGSMTEGLRITRLRGGLQESLRFFHTVDPAIKRKRTLEGQALKSSARLQIVGIEPIKRRIPLYDITTGTGDFFANGVVSHNCYARPSHEYWGLSAGLDFETKIFVKEDAPKLLSEAFQKESWTPQPVAMSGNTDPYQPVERELEITRSCLNVFLRHRNPVSIVTKSGLIRRDADVLSDLAEGRLVNVLVSLTSLDADLAGTLEPRAARPSLRLKTVETLTDAGVPVGILLAPVIPGLNDEEIPRILEAAAERGASFAGYVLLRLPGAVADVFEDWLDEHMPHRKDRILGRLRSLRDGELNDTEFGTRMRGRGEWSRVLRQLFRNARRSAGLASRGPDLSTDDFRRLPGGQRDLFDAS